MSWSELERLVETAELEPPLRRALRRCRSVRELVLASCRLGFLISTADLREARALDRGLASGSAGEAGPSALARPVAPKPAATVPVPLAS